MQPIVVMQRFFLGFKNQFHEKMLTIFFLIFRKKTKRKTAKLPMLKLISTKILQNKAKYTQKFRKRTKTRLLKGVIDQNGNKNFHLFLKVGDF